MNTRKGFGEVARRVTAATGSAYASGIIVLLISSWFVGGLFFGFGTDYQIIINTSTTIITCVMAFLIQNTQNAQDHALHLKLDELLRAVEAAREDLVGVEQVEPDE